MNDFIKINALLDQYSNLLTAKQREICQYYYREDCSLSEISEITQTSRASISDMINRVDKMLMEYENKLGLVQQQEEINKALNEYYLTKNIRPLLEILEKRESEIKL
jgi:uncharacterized protein